MPVSNLKHLGEGRAAITLKTGERRLVNVVHNDRSGEVLRVEVGEGAFASVSYSDIKRASPKTIARSMFLQVGSRRYVVASFEQASRMVCQARDASGMGASEMGSKFDIFDDAGNGIAYVSYNGRVWPGTEYQAGAVALYPVDGGYVR